MKGRQSRNFRSSSMYSAGSTNQSQINSSKAMIRSGIPKNTLLNQSTMKSSQQHFPTIDTNKQDDQYIEKLHGHISFLNSSIGKMKNEQKDYKQSMMNMMHPNDNQQVVDHAITTQSKFKDMKQNLIRQIHQLQHQNIMVINEVLALQASKKFLEDSLDFQQDNMEIGQRKLKNIYESSKSEYAQKRERREQNLLMIEKLQEDYQKALKEHKLTRQQRQHKQELDRYDEEMFQLNKQIAEKDIEVKKLQVQELKKDIDQLNKEQEQDVHYQELVDKKKELKINYENFQVDYDRLQYDIEIVEENLKYAQNNKDKNQIEFQNLKTELDKYKDIIQQVQRRNDQKIANHLENNKGYDLTQKLKEVHKINKRKQEFKLKYDKIEKEFREMSLFILDKQQSLDDINFENQMVEDQLNGVNAQINLNKTKYDTTMASIVDDSEKFDRLQRVSFEDEQEIIFSEKKHVYLKSKYEKLQEKVQLEEEMRKIQVDQLKNITNDNVMFNQNVNHFYQNWGQMQQFGRRSQIQ